MSALFAGVGDGPGLNAGFVAAIVSGLCCLALSPLVLYTFWVCVYEWNRRRDANRGGGTPL